MARILFYKLKICSICLHWLANYIANFIERFVLQFSTKFIHFINLTKSAWFQADWCQSAMWRVCVCELVSLLEWNRRRWLIWFLKIVVFVAFKYDNIQSDLVMLWKKTTTVATKRLFVYGLRYVWHINFCQKLRFFYKNFV